MSTCRWCTPGGASTLYFLQSYSAKALSPQEHDAANEDLCYCLECVIEYHKARDSLPLVPKALLELEASRLINHFEKALNQEACDEDELILVEDEQEIQLRGYTGPEFENNLRVPLLEILKYPYLLLHKRVGELCVESLCKMEQGNYSFQVFDKHPGIYLLLVHPDEMIRRWAISTARSLGKVDRDDYYELQEVFTCLFKVIELDLFENADIYLSSAIEREKLNLLPQHLYDSSNYKNYWLGICMLLTILEDQALDSLILGPDRQTDLLNAILNTMDKNVEDESNDPFWPALQCFMVILDRLGSKVWGQAVDPTQAFQTIIGSQSYNKEIDNIRNTVGRRNKIKMEPDSDCADDMVSCSQMVYECSTKKPNKDTGWKNAICPDYCPNMYEEMQTLVNLLQSDAGQDMRVHNSTFLWFIPYVQSVIDLKELGVAYIGEVIHHLYSEMKDVLDKKVQFCDKVTEFFILILVSIIELHRNKNCVQLLWFSSQKWVEALVKCVKLPAKLFSRSSEKAGRTSSKITPTTLVTSTSVHPQVNNTVQHASVQLIRSFLREGFQLGLQSSCQKFLDQLNKQLRSTFILGWQLDHTETQDLQACLKHIVKSIKDRNASTNPRVKNPDPYGTLHINIKQEVEESVELQQSLCHRSSSELQPFSEFGAERLLSKGEKTDCDCLPSHCKDQPFDTAECQSVVEGKGYQTEAAVVETPTAECEFHLSGYVKSLQNQPEDSSDVVKCRQPSEGMKLSSKGCESSLTGCIENQTLLDEETSKCHSSADTTTTEESTTIVPPKNIHIDLAKFRTFTKKLSAIIGKDLPSKKESLENKTTCLKTETRKAECTYSEFNIAPSICGNKVEESAKTRPMNCEEKFDISVESKRCSKRLSGDEHVVSSSSSEGVNDPDRLSESESDDNVPLQDVRKDLIKRKSFDVRLECDISVDTNVDRGCTTLLRPSEEDDVSAGCSGKDPSLQPLDRVGKEAETCNKHTYESSDGEELRNDQVIIISDSDSSMEDSVTKHTDSSGNDSVEQSSSKKVIRKDQKHRTKQDTEQLACGIISSYIKKNQQDKEKHKSKISPGFEENDSQFFEFETENEVFSVWQDSQLNSSKDSAVAESKECHLQADKNIEDLYNDWGYDTDYVPDEVIQVAVERAETNLLKKANTPVKSEADITLKKCTSELNSENISLSFYSKKTVAQFQSVPCTTSTDKLLADDVQRDSDAEQVQFPSTILSEQTSAKNLALKKKTNINKMELKKKVCRKKAASKNEASSSKNPRKRKVSTNMQKKKSRVQPDACETRNRKPHYSAKRTISQTFKLPAVVPPKKERRGFEPASTVEKLGLKKKARKAFDLSQRSLNSLTELRSHGRTAGKIENKTRPKTKLIPPQKLTGKGRKKLMASQEIQFFKQSRPKKMNLHEGNIHSTLSDSMKKQVPQAVLCERDRPIGEKSNQVKHPLNKPLSLDIPGNEEDNQTGDSYSPKQRNGLFLEGCDPLGCSTEPKHVEQAAPLTRIAVQIPKPAPTSDDAEDKSETFTSLATPSGTESGAEVTGVLISAAVPGQDGSSGDESEDKDDADALFLTQYDPVDMDICSQEEEGEYLVTCTVNDPVDMIIDANVDASESTKQLASDFPTHEYKQTEVVTAPGTSCPPSAVSGAKDNDLFLKPGLPLALPKPKKLSSTKVYSSSSTSRNAQLCKELENVCTMLPPPVKTKSNLQPVLKRDTQRPTPSLISAPQDSASILQALNRYVNNKQKNDFSLGVSPSSDCVKRKDNQISVWDSLQQYDQSYFVHEILEWKYDTFANLSKFGAPETLCQFPVTQIPDHFSKYDEYFRVFLSLLMLNTFEEVGQEWMNNQRTKKNTLYCLTQTGFCSENNMNRVDCQVFIQAKDLAKQMHPKEDDLVFLWPQKHESSANKDKLEMEGSVDSLCITGRISRFVRSTVNDNRHEDLLTFLVSVQTLGNFSAYRGQQLMCEVISSLVTSQRQFRALLQLNRSPLVRAILNPYITAFTPREQVDTSSCNSTSSYNREQEKAINLAVAMVKQNTAVPKICLIHGPPGTGKSKTIVGLLFRILIEDQENVVPAQNLNAKAKRNRVLVCAPSNAAVDCLMKKIIIEFKEKQKDKKNALGNCGDINLLRLGSEKTISTDVLKFSLDYQVQNKIRRTQVYSDQDIQKKSDTLDRRLDELSRERAMFRRDKEKCQKLDEEIRRCSDERRKLGRMLKADRGRILEMQGKIILESHVICCTLSTSGSILLETAFRRLGHCPFSCVVVDEAGQACETEILIPLIHRCPKLVLVGDPEQLPPTVISMKAQEHRYGQPMITRLYHCLQQEAKRTNSKLPVLYLSTQYRMHPDICHFPSKFIYNKNLKTDSDTEAKRCSSNWPFQPYLLFDVTDGHENREQEAAACSHIPGFWGSYANPQEIKLIVFLIKLMTCKKDVPFRSIGIITPYSAQKKLILHHLQQEFKDVSSQSIKALEVDTVDGFQGCEKDCIIVTCVRANALQGSIGFLASRQRLNVTITRARFSLFILGSLKTLMDNKDWNALIQDAHKRGAIIRTCEKDYEKDVNKILKRKPTMQRTLSHPAKIHSVEKPAAHQRTKSSDGCVPGSSVSSSSGARVSRHGHLPNTVSQVAFRPQATVRSQNPVTSNVAKPVSACSIPVPVNPPIPASLPILIQPSAKERPKDPRLARRAAAQHTSNQMTSNSVNRGTASHLDYSKNSSNTLLSGSVSFGLASSRAEHCHSSGTFNASTSSSLSPSSSSSFCSSSYEAGEDQDYRPLYRQGRNWSAKNDTGSWSKDQDHRLTTKRPVSEMYNRQDRTYQQSKRRKE